jgi:hypothetical protein
MGEGEKMIIFNFPGIIMLMLGSWMASGVSWRHTGPGPPRRILVTSSSFPVGREPGPLTEVQGLAVM